MQYFYDLQVAFDAGILDWCIAILIFKVDLFSLIEDLRRLITTYNALNEVCPALKYCKMKDTVPRDHILLRN